MTSASLLLALSLSAHQPARRPADGWWGPDKVKHFFMSAFVQSVSYSALRLTGADRRVALGGSSVVTAGVGLGRELYDRRAKGLFSTRDLVWDAAGAGAAGALLWRAR